MMLHSRKLRCKYTESWDVFLNLQFDISLPNTLDSLIFDSLYIYAILSLLWLQISVKIFHIFNQTNKNITFLKFLGGKKNRLFKQTIFYRLFAKVNNLFTFLQLSTCSLTFYSQRSLNSYTFQQIEVMIDLIHFYELHLFFIPYLLLQFFQQ